jgi:hypothetical protein
VYRDAPDHALYQGDLVIVPMVALAGDDPQIISLEELPPPAPCGNCGTVPRATGKNQRKYRPASVRLKKKEAVFATNDTEDAVASVRTVVGVLLSHSCDIDRQAQVRVAVVQSVAAILNEAQADSLRAGRPGNLSYVYLPPCNTMPEAVINLDMQFFVSARVLGQRRMYRSVARREEPALAPYREAIESRVASLNDDGLKRLYYAMLLHMTRPATVDVQYDGFSPGQAVFADDPGRPQRAQLPTRGWSWPTPGWLRSAEQLELLKK